MKITHYIIAVVIFLLALPLAGQAGWNNDAQICLDKSGDEAIAACTRAIQSGQLSQNSLATTYSNRGVEWRQKGEIDKAMEDYNEALSLNPNYIKAYGNRGSVYLVRQQYDKALDDMKQAFRLNPKDSYVPLMLAVTRMHKGDVNFVSELAVDSATFDQNWPNLLVQLYLGKLTPEEYLAAARNAGLDAKYSCSHSFYFGEWLLHNGQKTQAIANFKTAKASCDYTLMEYFIADHELLVLQ